MRTADDKPIAARRPAPVRDCVALPCGTWENLVLFDGLVRHRQFLVMPSLGIRDLCLYLSPTMQPAKKAKEDPKPKPAAKKVEAKAPVKREVKKEEPTSASKAAAVAVKREKKVYELPGVVWVLQRVESSCLRHACPSIPLDIVSVRSHLNAVTP